MMAEMSAAELIDNLVVAPLQNLSNLATLYLPRLLGAIVMLVAGRLGAGILRRLTRDVLRAMGLDVLLQRLGVVAALERAGVRRRPSELAGVVVFWVIILSALMLALEALGLDSAALLLRAMLVFTPRLVVAMVLVGFGLVLAENAGRVVERTAEAAAIPASRLWGQLTRWGVMGFAAVAILEELQIASQTLRLGLLGLLAMGPVGAAIAVGLGGQGIAKELLAGQVVRSSFRVGDRVELKLDGRPIQGRIERFELASVLLRKGVRDGQAELLSIPYSCLASGVVGLSRPEPAGTPVPSPAGPPQAPSPEAGTAGPVVSPSAGTAATAPGGPSGAQPPA